MNDTIKELTELLLTKNNRLTYGQAERWVDFLWSDFESTYAKAGEYHGSTMTERVVRQWIEHYGEKLHEFVSNNPKYAHLLEEDHLQ